MIGLAFYCNGCHRFKATQDGHVLRLANGYWSTPRLKGNARAVT
jgi:hypothetical protein